jgi:hypothetical protein
MRMRQSSELKSDMCHSQMGSCDGLHIKVPHPGTPPPPGPCVAMEEGSPQSLRVRPCLVELLLQLHIHHEALPNNSLK